MKEKFTKQDRALVVGKLEEIQKTKISPVGESRRFFSDEKKRFYFIIGSQEDWHGISAKVMEEIAPQAKNTLLVVAKKYRTRIDICVATADEIVKRSAQLPRTKAGDYHFHTVIEEDGLSVLQLPDLHLKKISEIALTAKTEQPKLPANIAKIINIELLPTATKPEVNGDEQATHSDIQAKLILIGGLLGYHTFTPDKSKMSRYGKLGNLCSVKTLSSDYIPQRQIATIKNIDVMWLDEDFKPTHGFEVEHKTDVTKGLLRLYQARKLTIKMYIIAPSAAKNKFAIKIKNDPFFQMKEEYIFKTYEELESFFEATRRFSTLRQDFLCEEQLKSTR